MNGIKIHIEIGHESALKAKPTPDGFTHDWELFVRSCNSHDISHFIDKVVFNLHESFAKPKRVIKEPPYVLKESGYAGFELVIDVYVKNREEPKKISFQYDLDLQNSGPLCRTQTFSHTFFNPAEDFRRKLLKGGGVSCNTSLVNNFDEKSRDRLSSSSNPTTTSTTTTQGSAMSAASNGDAGKGTATSSASGKHKSREQQLQVSQPPVNSEFASLFGTPITKATAATASASSTASSTLKVSPDPKAHRKTSPNRTANSSSGSSTKGSASGGGKGEKGGSSATNSTSSAKEKSSSSSRSRHGTNDSPHVDRGDKFERREADKGKRERNRSREREGGNKGSNGSSSSSSNNKEKSQKRRPSSPKYSSPSGGGGGGGGGGAATGVGSSSNNNNNSSSNNNSGSKSRSPTRGSSDHQSSKPTASSTAALATAATGKPAGESGNSKKSSKKEKKDKSHDKERGATNNNNNNSAPLTADHQSRDQLQPPGKKDRDSSGSGKRDGASGNSKDPSNNKHSTGNNTNSNHSGRGGEEKFGQSGQNKKEDKQRGPEKDGVAVAAVPLPGSSPLDSLKKHKHKKKDKEKGGGGGGVGVKGGSKDQDAKVSSPAANYSQLGGAKGTVTPPSSAVSSGGAKEKKLRRDGLASNNSPANKPVVSSSEKSQDAFGYNSKTGNHSNLSDSEGSEQLAEPLQADEALTTTAFGKSAGRNKSKHSERGEKRKRRGRDESDGELEKRNKRKLKDDLSEANSSPNKMEPPQKLPRKQVPPSEDGYLNRNGCESSLGGGVENNNNNSYHGTSNHMRMAEPEYIQELKVLQHKIMTLQDSNDLQQVVEIIAVTGLYEIADATKTFDFDLCVLNAETVQRLKDFFLMRTK